MRCAVYQSMQHTNGSLRNALYVIVSPVDLLLFCFFEAVVYPGILPVDGTSVSSVQHSYAHPAFCDL